MIKNYKSSKTEFWRCQSPKTIFPIMSTIRLERGWCGGKARRIRLRIQNPRCRLMSVSSTIKASNDQASIGPRAPFILLHQAATNGPANAISSASFIINMHYIKQPSTDRRMQSSTSFIIDINYIKKPWPADTIFCVERGSNSNISSRSHVAIFKTKKYLNPFAIILLSCGVGRDR